MESFFKTLKYEGYLCEYHAFADVVAKLPFFVEEVYNHKRPHSVPGYHSPNDFEEQLMIHDNKELPRQILPTLPLRS